MRKSVLDLYERWELNKELAPKLKAIQELVSKRATQKQVAEYLGITEKTLIKLKKAHPKLQRAFVYGNEDLRNKLEDALLKRAIGFEFEEVQTTIEETKSGTKKKIVKTKKQVSPETNAAKYLLVIHFGLDYNERKSEIELMRERLAKGEEVWMNENSDEETRRPNRIRKQPEEQ